MVRDNIITNIAKCLQAQHLDAVLVAPSIDLELIMDFSPFLCERFQGLFVKQNGEYFYIANLLSKEEIASAMGSQAKVYSWWDGEDYVEVVKSILYQEGLQGKVIGTSESVRAFHILNFMERMDIRFTSARALLEETRIAKTSEELDCLRTSAKIADEALTAALPQIHPGMSERQIGDILFAEMSKRGGDCPGGLICTGENTGYPHYARQGEGRILQEKDVLLMDFGCRYQGYWSDITRTVFFGEPTEKEREVYQAVLEANLAGEEAAVLGVFIPDIDRAARERIEKTGYGHTFTTRLGHGIGRKVHEAPDIKQSHERKLECGMAFSIEPGIYLPGEFGVRIEDIVVINERGEREVLNKATKELLICS